MKKIATAAALVAASMAAHAQFYGEVGYSVTTINNKEPGYSFEAKPKSLRGLVGYDFNENIALEGIVGFGISESNGTEKKDGASSRGGKLRLNSVLGLYITPKLEVVDGLETFVRLGAARTSLKSKETGGTYDTEIATSPSYGIGVRYKIDSQLSINADYMSYGKVGDNNYLKSKGFTIGAGYRF